MNNYFVLDPYFNYYECNLLVNKLVSEFRQYNHPLFNNTQNDYLVIANMLELRFIKDINDVIKNETNIDPRILSTKIEFTDNHFYSRNIFFNQRYGRYINQKLNDLLNCFDIDITYDRKNALLYDIFIETCNLSLPENSETWLIIKANKKINTYFEWFMNRLSGEIQENPNQLYIDNYKLILNQIKNYQQAA